MSGYYSIGEVAERLDLSIDALRYYERIGVVPPAQRDASGRRRYGIDDLHLLEVLLHLRNTGMPLKKIAEFTKLVRQDPEGVPERLALLRDHRKVIVGNIARQTNSLRVIDGKIEDYSSRLDVLTEDVDRVGCV